MYSPLLLLGLIGVSTVKGQALPNKDSLLLVWNEPQLAATHRMRAVNALIQLYYMPQNPDSARIFAESLDSVALQAGDSYYMAKANTYKG